MPRVRVTLPLEAAPAAIPPACPENFVERTWRLLNERSDVYVSTNDTRIVVVKNRPAEEEPPSQPDNFVEAAFYIKLKVTLEVNFFWGWGVFIQQNQFNKLNDRMSKLKKGQNMNKSVEETAMELYGEISIEDKIIIKFIMQRVAAAVAEEKKQY